MNKTEIKDYIKELLQEKVDNLYIKDNYWIGILDGIAKVCNLTIENIIEFQNELINSEDIRMDIEKFFKDEFNKRYIDQIPCEDLSDEDDCEEGSVVDAFEITNRLMILITNPIDISVFKQKDNTKDVYFKKGKDIFTGETFTVLPNLLDLRYLEDVVIFSGEKVIELDNINIGEVIDKIIKEQNSMIDDDF
jgi:hypothetical protein